MVALLPEVQRAVQGKTVTRVRATQQRTFLLAFTGGIQVVLNCKPRQERFHLACRPYQKQNTPFTHLLEQHIVGFELTDATLATNDRILTLSFPPYRLIAELIPSRGNLLLVSSDDAIVAALCPPKTAHYHPPQSPPYVPGAPLSLTSEEVEERADFQTAQQNAIKECRKRIKALHRRLSTLRHQWEEAEQWEQVFHEAELLQTYFSQLHRGMTEIALTDWLQEGAITHLSLQPNLTPKEQVEARYKKARKRKRSLPFLEQEIEMRKGELRKALSFENQATTAQTSDDLPPITKKAAPKPSKAQTALPFRRYQTRDGMALFVGKNDRENDHLSFRFAHGSDWWFHAHNVPGAHVVLRVPRGTKPSQEAIDDALQIAAHHSRARKEAVVDVTVTQVKWLRRPKGGKRGAVWLTEYKVMSVRPNPDALKKQKPER